MRWAADRLACTAFLALAALPTSAEGPEVLRVGHWVELKGRFDQRGTLVVSAVELKPAEEYEALTGTVGDEQTGWEEFVLLGQPIKVDEVDQLVRAEGIDAASPAGLRLKVEGRWRGPRKLSAREIGTRGAGREAVEGRIDALERVNGGWELRVMTATAFVPSDLELELAAPLAELAPIAPRGTPVGVRRIEVDEDDEIPESIRLADGLYLGGQVEWRTLVEDELDLDETDDEDRVDHEASLRARLRWVIRDDVELVATWRRRVLWRIDDDDGRVTRGNGRVGETYLRVEDVAGHPLELLVGRQDFDDAREWIYDEDLDAVRFVWRPGPVVVELSASTVLADGSPREEDLTNLVAYVSNADEDRHLAAWVFDRRDASAADDEPIHFGLRAVGEFVPDNDSWIELAMVKGYRGNVDLNGVGWDVGTTFSPDWLSPFDVTVGWAFGRGDDPSTTGDDEAFVQTGLQDNNAKFGGVTSFRYYGELLDPELSNLSILTLGIGARVAYRTSLDLVWHHYRQDVALDRLRDAELDDRPSGIDRQLGSELDLVLGCRAWRSFDLELSAGWFRPGDAFPGGDDAFVAKIQVRYKF